jgi:hypothetical protein
VGDLVVGDREGLGGAGVEELQTELGPDLDQPGLAEGTVHVDGAGHGRDAVLGQHDDPCAVPLRVRD